MTDPDVTISAGAVSVSAFITGPVMVSSDSGWTETARPLQKAMPEWTGKPLDRANLPLLLDEWPDGSVQDMADTLMGLMRRPAKAATPPVVTCRGPRMPFDAAARWVVESVAWGDDQLFTRDGRLARQDVTVTLMESPDDEPTVVKVRGNPTTRRIILAAPGDTLEKIARRELGSPKRVGVLRALNPGVRPGRPIKAGTVVVVP